MLKTHNVAKNIFSLVGPVSLTGRQTPAIRVAEQLTVVLGGAVPAKREGLVHPVMLDTKSEGLWLAGTETSDIRVSIFTRTACSQTTIP